MNTELLSVDSITILPFVQRPIQKVRDDMLRKSIEKGGIQQPLVVVRDGERRLLVEGLRRLRIARVLRLGKVPVVIDDVPEGKNADDYVREMRFILDEHRQDPLPSQRAELIEILKRTFSMSHRQVAAYLGINSDSVTNWLSVKHYIPPVVKALDSGRLTMQAARAFDGLSEEGQQFIWNEHGADLANMPGALVHAGLREKYPPAQFPQYYRNPEMISERLSRTRGKRKGSKRPNLTSDEKHRLLSSFELREIELRELKADHDQLSREISAAIAPVGAVLRNEQLLALVPEEMRPELQRFAEIYVSGF